MMFPRTNAQWARTLAFLMVPIVCFVIVHDWVGFWVISPLALLYVLIFLSRFVRVQDGRGLSQMTILRFIRKEK